MLSLPYEEEPLGLIEGQVPDSKEEYWVAQALWKYEIRFMYQFQIFGGVSRRGGLIVDFLVWNPMRTPLLVHGDYWHENEMDGGDRTSLVAIESYFKKDAIILWGSDAETKEDVFDFVRDNVVR